MHKRIPDKPQTKSEKALRQSYLGIWARKHQHQTDHNIEEQTPYLSSNTLSGHTEQKHPSICLIFLGRGWRAGAALYEKGKQTESKQGEVRIYSGNTWRRIGKAGVKDQAGDIMCNTAGDCCAQGTLRWTSRAAATGPLTTPACPLQGQRAPELHHRPRPQLETSHHQQLWCWCYCCFFLSAILNKAKHLSARPK